MKKTFFLIPGFGMQISDNMYSWLVSFLEESNFKVIAVPVTWSRRTVSQNAADFLIYFNLHKTEENYILGFSYGAVIALLTAEQTKPNTLFLCSLSPDFVEDRATMPKDITKYIGKKRYLDTKTRSAHTLAKKLKVKTIIFYGEQEALKFPSLKKRAEETVSMAKNVKLIVVSDAPHDISYPTYQTAIKKQI